MSLASRRGPAVRFVTKRWPHHSTHSGYDRIIPYLGSAIPPVDLERLTSRWIPERIAVRFTRGAGVRGYFMESFYSEWAAAREMLLRPGRGVYHILYGDDTYRYLGAVRRVRRHSLVVSYHLPPAILEQDVRHREHLGRADAIVVVGRNQIPFFARYCGEDRVHFIPHGIDTDVFCPLPEADARTGEGRQVLFVGSHRRDFAVLSRVTELVGQADPEVSFVLVTNPKLVESFAGRDNVRLRHQVSEPELIRLYREASVVLQPLEESTANNSVLEGLACGTPVVATDVGGVKDYVTPSCARLTPPGDADSMAEAIMEISRDDAARSRMGIEARQQALSFSWPEVSAQLARLYESLA